jgi:hypothetical protein
MHADLMLLAVPIAPLGGLAGLFAAGRLEERTWRRLRETIEAEEGSPASGGPVAGERIVLIGERGHAKAEDGKVGAGTGQDHQGTEAGEGHSEVVIAGTGYGPGPTPAGGR